MDGSHKTEGRGQRTEDSRQHEIHGFVELRRGKKWGLLRESAHQGNRRKEISTTGNQEKDTLCLCSYALMLLCTSAPSGCSTIVESIRQIDPFYAKRTQLQRQNTEFRIQKTE